MIVEDLFFDRFNITVTNKHMAADDIRRLTQLLTPSQNICPDQNYRPPFRRKSAQNRTGKQRLFVL